MASYETISFQYEFFNNDFINNAYELSVEKICTTEQKHMNQLFNICKFYMLSKSKQFEQDKSTLR